MDQIYGCPGEVIFTARVNRSRVPETPQIFLESVHSECGRGHSIKSRFQPSFGAVAKQRFRKWRLLNQEPPMKIDRRQFICDGMEKFVCRNNVEDSKLCHAIGVIQGHAMGNSSATIVTHDREFLKS